MLQYKSLTDLATPLWQVSAFCRAVLSKLVPDGLWGSGETRRHNKSTFLHQVKRFIYLRRHERITLHEILQGLKISGINWLSPPGLRARKMSLTENSKRVELFAEFVFFLVDSLLVPLIRNNFYVTESSADRYRLFFFRHDTWRFAIKPATEALKVSMFEEVRPGSLDIKDVHNLEDPPVAIERSLGYSSMRLVPKATGDVRPVINLRHHVPMPTSIAQGVARTKLLPPSINKVLVPVGQMLNLERELHPERLGSSMFSVSEIYQRIKAFKYSVWGSPLLSSPMPRFYFVKIDVKAAFNTIPQEALLALMHTVATHRRYPTLRHARISPPDHHGTGTNPVRPWHTHVRPAQETASFAELLEGETGPLSANSKRNTVFIKGVVRTDHEAAKLLELLESHVRYNIVRIGRKLYRQRHGISQGSVLSTALCNYFYAGLEDQHLGFLSEDDSLLVRLIDDFLLITTDRAKAVQFAVAMYNGFPDYGVSVSRAKTLVNFNLKLDGEQLPSIAHKTRPFPYCGIAIDTATLDVANFTAPALGFDRAAVFHADSRVCAAARPDSGAQACDRVQPAGARHVLRHGPQRAPHGGS